MSAPAPQTISLTLPSSHPLTVCYRATPATPDPARPTLLFLHTVGTSSALFAPQFAGPLAQTHNLVAPDLLGHGATRAGDDALEDAWDYDTQAEMVVALMDALHIPSATLTGVSQGGFIAPRVATLLPAARVPALLLLGTSLLAETTAHNSWDVSAAVGDLRLALEADATAADAAAFTPPDAFVDALVGLGFGAPDAAWEAHVRETYGGALGRRRLRRVVQCLMDRPAVPGLREMAAAREVRVGHGTADVVYGVGLAREGAGLMGLQGEVRVVEGGRHFLSASHPEVVVEMVREVEAAVAAKTAA
ncbi:Alpha/Beta hydrolase protein [Geopyxis carbonaria]|nr:Alpha/Beta hydrolase protein [Geopyxis carbonaria]